MIPILHGIGGSHAYGLNNAQSDEDHVGVMSYPTADFWSLSKPADHVVLHEPYDLAFHELEKYCSLAAKSNPTVLEIMFLDSYIEQEPVWGEALIDIRMAFPSKNYVYNAYMGYAESQFRKLNTRGDGKFSSDTGNRVGKHARHTIRLLEQGYKLYTTGELALKVDNPQYYRDVSDMSPAQLAEEFTRRWSDFIDAPCALPDRPDFDAINEYIHEYRLAHVQW